jgi:cytochrome P450
MLLVNILPSLTTRRGYRGRTTVAQAFHHYFSQNGHESASVLVKNRFKVCMEHQLPLEDIARFEVGGVVAIAVSTVPAAFWMLYYVYSNPDILELLRQEVGAILETKSVEASPGTVTRTLNITELRTTCPLLTSTFQETLRHASLGAAVRLVTEDTVLDGHILLKKGSLVEIPAHVVHFDSTIWGSSVTAFDASRFVLNPNVKSSTKPKNDQADNKKKPHPGDFRAFGGGRNLCPGRHFAATEILALVAMMVMRYDLHVVTTSNGRHNESGRWKMPTSVKSGLAAAVREPDEDIDVEVRLREGYEEGRWAFRLEESELVFAIDDVGR